MPLVLASAGLAGLAAASPAGERGFPLLRSYEPALDEAAVENFGVAQDVAGLLYVGNLAGLLVYDGAWWRLVEVGSGRAALSVASDDAGRVAVGAPDDFGVLAAGGRGSLEFVSLVESLPVGERELGDVVAVQPVEGGFAFLAQRRLVLWRDGAARTVAEFPSEGPTPASFGVAGTVYLWTAEGLFRLAGSALEPVPGGERFRARRVDLMLTADPGSALVAVRGEGFSLLDLESGATAGFAPAASRRLAAHQATSGLRLPDGRWAVGSQLGGLLLLAADGGIEQVIDTAVGLSDDSVAEVLLDREGSLWLALNSGLARVEVGSPLSVIDARSGLKGAVYHVARHRGELWVAGSAGLFTSAGAGGAGGAGARMAPVRGVPAPAWSLVSMGEELLVGTTHGVWVLGAGGARVIAGTEAATAYLLSPSRADPARLWVGMRDGLGAVRREPGGWRWEGRVEGVPRYVRSLVERGSVLWCGTTFDGVVRVELPAAGPFAAPPEVSIEGAAAETGVYPAGERILVTRSERVMTLDEATGLPVEDPGLAGLSGHGGVYHLAVDAEGNLWMNTVPPAVAPRHGGGWVGEERTLVPVPARNVETVVPEPDGVVWLGGDNGLYRHAGGIRGVPERPPPAPFLSRVTLGGGRLLWGGAPGALPARAVLGPEDARLRVEFAPASFRSGLHFQTRLDPIDRDWSPPTAEPAVELARLAAGEYAFRVRTVGAGGEVGPETAWEFEVLPPWYLTSWALSLAVVVAAAAVVGYSRWRSRALRRRAAHLAARVEDQTVELRRTVEQLSRTRAQLEEKNRLLASANARLEELSLADELTGIPNRRRWRQALAEEWRRARRHRQPLAVVLADLDHFKSLNDTRGHPEGDRALEAVARYLAGEVRRTGDVVARYGGEEFALLLPGTDLAAARELAERLRRGVEALAVLHPASPAGRLTASFGVAAVVPPAEGEDAEDAGDADGAGPETLVQAADAALYRAKTEGRNRVRSAA